MNRFHRFLLLSAALTAAIAIISGSIVGRFFHDHVLGHVERHYAELVEVEAQEQLVPDVFTGPHDPSHARRFERFADGVPWFFRIKAYDTKGTIVWSNEPRLIGRSFPDDPGFIRAMRGETSTVIGEPSGPEHRYEHASAVAEQWVPVRLPGSPRVIGVLELYRNIAPMLRDLQRTKWRIWGVVGVGAVVLWAAVAFLGWKASANEIRMIRRLEAQNRQLRLVQRITRSLLRPMDPGRVAESVVANAAAGLRLSRAAIYRADGSGPRLLAAWPPGTAPVQSTTCTHDPGPNGSRAPADVEMPITTHNGVTHLFTAGIDGRPLSRGAMHSLEIILDQVAIALGNTELFAEIREAHERLSAILAGIADRMLIVDRDMRIVWMNAANTDAAGKGDNLLGTPCRLAFAADPGACDNCPAARTFSSGAVERGLRTMRLPNGETRYMDLVTAPLRDASGRIHQVLEVARDITDLVRMEERLKETNQALVDAQAKLVEKERLAAIGQIVVALHHAILNPLTGILGALQVLEGETLTAAARSEALAAAKVEVRNIEQLVRRLTELRQAEGVPYVGGTTMLDLTGATSGEEHPRPRRA